MGYAVPAEPLKQRGLSRRQRGPLAQLGGLDRALPAPSEAAEGPRVFGPPAESGPFTRGARVWQQ